MAEEIITSVIGAAEYLNISRETVFRLIKAGEFPQPQVNILRRDKRVRMWHASELDKFRKNLRKRGQRRKSSKTEGVSK